MPITNTFRDCLRLQPESSRDTSGLKYMAVDSSDESARWQLGSLIQKGRPIGLAPLPRLASDIGPDLARHYAGATYTSKLDIPTAA